MKTRKTILLIVLLILLLSLGLNTAAAQEELPKVHVIIFYSPSCLACEFVVAEDIQPLIDLYGDQLVIVPVDISIDSGSRLFAKVLENLNRPTSQATVPFLLVGSFALDGPFQIQEELPILVAAGAGNQGIAWPNDSALLAYLENEGYLDADGIDITPTPGPEAVTGEQGQDAAEPTPTEEPAAISTEEVTAAELEPGTNPGVTPFDEDGGGELFGSFGERFNRDPLANGIAVVVLLFLVGVAVYIGVKFMQAAELRPWPNWILIVLLVAGIAIAGYLASIEVSGEAAICGPVGDCNAVQQSEYATLFGFLPVAILGLIGYIMIGITWWIGQSASGQTAFYAKLAMFLFALFGLLFFIYLTFLEPFVIGATCAWCISSAIIMAFINLFTLRIALDAWTQMED